MKNKIIVQYEEIIDNYRVYIYTQCDINGKINRYGNIKVNRKKQVKTLIEYKLYINEFNIYIKTLIYDNENILPNSMNVQNRTKKAEKEHIRSQKKYYKDIKLSRELKKKTIS